MTNSEFLKIRTLAILPFAFFFVIGLTACQKLRLVTIQTSTDQVSVMVEVARTPQEKATGLMYRKALLQGEGMLFVYDKSLIPPFWMKNTLIPLDILFIGSDLRIKHIAEDTPPCPPQSQCPTYAPSEPVQYVLELNGGDAKRQKIGLGDRVDLSNIGG